METFSRWLYLFFEEFEPTKDTLTPVVCQFGYQTQITGPLDHSTRVMVSNPVATSSVVLKVRTFFSTYRVPSVTCPVFLLSDPNLQSNETSLSGCAANLEDQDQK